MTQKSGKDDLFMRRMILALDFDELVDDLVRDAHDYLEAHSAEYRKWCEVKRRAVHVLEQLKGQQLRALKKLAKSLDSLDTTVSVRFWATGMLAAFHATQPDFDPSALSKQVWRYKTQHYSGILKAVQSAYDAAESVVPPGFTEHLAQYQLAAEQMIRFRAVGSLFHGFEWTAQALKEVGFRIKQADAAAVYRVFGQL